MKHIGIVLFVICFLTACNNKNINKNGAQLEVDYKNLNKLNLSEFVDDIKVIRLQSTDGHIVGQISKVLVFDNNIYIWDQLSNMLFIYDMNGNILNTLNKIGNGPEEYIKIIDFDIDEKGIYIVDFPSHSVKLYNFNLEFERKIAYSFFGSNILATDESIWLYNEYSVGSSYYRLFRIDNESHILSEYFEQNALAAEPKYNWVSSNVFQKYGDKYYFSDRYSNTIFIYNQNNWNEYVSFSFGNKTFPKEKQIFDYDINAQEFPYIIRREFFITEQYIIIDYIYMNDRYHSFYEKNSATLRSGKIENDIIPDYNRFFPRWSSNNYLIESVDAEYVLNSFKGLTDYEKSLADLRPEDNPVLVLYSLKGK